MDIRDILITARMKYSLFHRAIALLALFQGCTSNLQDADPTKDVNHEFKITSNSSTIEAPEISFSGSTGDDNEEVLVKLKMQSDHNGIETYLLEIKATYEGHWRNYIRAEDINGISLQGHATENHVTCELFCWFHDTVEVLLPIEYLSKHITKGISLHLVGPGVRSELLLQLNSSYINEFIARASKQSAENKQRKHKLARQS